MNAADRTSCIGLLSRATVGVRNFGLAVAGAFLLLPLCTLATAASDPTTQDSSVASPKETPDTGDFSRVMVDIAGKDENSILDQVQLKRYGIDLVFHRATLGIPPNADDDGFATGSDAVIAGGFALGAYHVIYPDVDGTHSGTAQADFFFKELSQVCARHPGIPIVVAVDWENTYRLVPRNGKKVRVSSGTADPAVVLEFLERAKEHYGASPLVYTGIDVIGSVKDSDAHRDVMNAMAAYPLWVATYQQSFYRKSLGPVSDNQTIVVTVHNGQTKKKPVEAKIGYIFPIKEDVAPWADWSLWQYGGGDRGYRDVTTKNRVVLGKIPVDMSFFNGSRSDFSHAFDANAYHCN